MKPRSLVFDLFGDYLRYRDGVVRLRALVALMACFDIPESTVRVVAARMRKEGWLESRREGRETAYALTDASWRLLDEGRTRIFARESDRGTATGAWSSTRFPRPTVPCASSCANGCPGWGSACCRRRSGSVRTTGSPRSGEFCRSPLGAARRAARPFGGCRGRPGHGVPLLGPDRPEQGVRGAGRPLPAAPRPLPGGELRGRDALVERMRLIHDYRLFPFRDPDLPPELLPEGWVGRVAHEVFLEAHGLLRTEAEGYVDLLLAEAGA